MAKPEEIIRKQIDKIAIELNLKEYNVEIKEISSEGTNYMSVNYKVILSSSDGSNLQLFAKVAQFSEAMREQVPIGNMYEKEILTYTQLFTKYEELQEKYCIPVEDRYKFAKYYAGSSEFEEECIIMEDLVAQGHTLYDRFKPITWEYAAKGVEELAKFHALSLAFKRKYPNEYTNIFSKDEEFYSNMIEKFQMTFTHLGKSGMSVVPDGLKSRVQKFIESQISVESFKKYFLADTRGFIIHGDFKANNVLFKRQGGKVKSFVPIDFQGTRLGSPLVDLLYFIYCGSDAEFRRLHLKELVKLYYETMVKFMRLLNLNPDEDFPKDAFDEEYKDKREYGLMTALTTLPIVLVDPENAPKTTGTDSGETASLAASSTSESYKKRIMPILNEFMTYGII